MEWLLLWTWMSGKRPTSSSGRVARPPWERGTANLIDVGLPPHSVAAL